MIASVRVGKGGQVVVQTGEDSQPTTGMSVNQEQNLCRASIAMARIVAASTPVRFCIRGLD
jgi:hypothetical protein